MSINLRKSAVKRGDTIVEVMFAIAIFSLIAVVAIMMMNSGIATGERSLELVTTRNELNAQAEALRFIHAAYSSERKRPECNGTNVSACPFQEIWENIINRSSGELDAEAVCEQGDLDEKYNNTLAGASAFALNARRIDSSGSLSNIIYEANDTDPTRKHIFRYPAYNARIIYNGGGTSSDNALSATIPSSQYHVASIEGIWVTLQRATSEADSTKTLAYVFNIQSCWYAPNASAPSVVDTAIRLYNPES